MEMKSIARMSTWFFMFLFLALRGYAQDPPPGDAEPVLADYHLQKAVMCERIKGSTPMHQTVAFSASKGLAFCYSVFDPVRRGAHIYHVWYYRDELVSRQKRILKPDRWETYSTQKISGKVKGPWRVEIDDADGEHIAILRFSVTE